MDILRSQLTPALLAWIDRIGCADPLPEALPASARWLLDRWGAGDDHLPLHLVHDLGHLLLRGRDFRFASTGALARWSGEARAERLAYEDKVLGRWALDPTVLDAHVAIAGMPAARRDTAVAHAVGLALAGPLLAAEDLARGNPAHLRALAPELLALAAEEPEALHDRVGDEWRAWADAQHAACVRALPSGRLFRAEDLWEIAHLPELPSESARLALRTILGLAARVGPVSPSVALTLRHRSREVPVEAEEADQYPAGGFDAISTRGTFENLVRSEVAYVGEGSAERGGVDLFDVRFAENELLFYTRDESPLLDARRDLTVVLHRPAAQRHKHPSLEAQTLVLTEALALALQGDLLRVFGPAGSRCAVVWLCDRPGDLDAAEEERALLSLPLAAEVAHRRVTLQVARSWDEVPTAGRVVCSPLAEDDAVARAAWVRVDEASWALGDARVEVAAGAPALRSLADRLLTMLTRQAPRRASKRAR
jgi:hypothetical protein